MPTRKDKAPQKKPLAKKKRRNPQPAPEGRSTRRRPVEDSDPLRQHEYHDQDGHSAEPPLGRPF